MNRHLLDVGDRLISVKTPDGKIYHVGRFGGPAGKTHSAVYGITVDRLPGPEGYYLVANIVFEGDEPDVIVPLSQANKPDPCWLVYYIGSAMLTSNRCSSVYQAKNIASEVGQWIPYCYGWHSADCRTLILRDALMGRKMLDEIEAEWFAEHGSTLDTDFPRAERGAAA